MLFQEPSDVERPVFLRLYLSTLTQRSLSTSDVEREEMRWLRYLLISQNVPLSGTERTFPS